MQIGKSHPHCFGYCLHIVPLPFFCIRLNRRASLVQHICILRAQVIHGTAFPAVTAQIDRRFPGNRL